MRRAWMILAVLGLAMASSCDRTKTADTTASRDLEKDAAAFHTKLRRVGPSPQNPHDFDAPPAGVQQVEFESGDLKLKAWIARPATADPNAKLPAVVFCHTGFAFGTSDWTGDAQPFLDNGFVVMEPMVRGENDNPGTFDLFLGEADDVNAAGRYLASLPNVDAKHVFVSGHTNGATLATLAVMKTTPFAAAAPISAVMDVRDVVRWDQPALLVFDMQDESEVNIRSPMMYASSIRVPLKLIVGTDDISYEKSQKLAESAEFFNKPCEVAPVPGDHNGAKPAGRQIAIDWFRELSAR